MPLCSLTGYLENCVYFQIVFSLLVVDCQLEIIEFLVIYNDVIDRQRNARSHQVSSENPNCSLARASEFFVCLVALCEILYSIYFRQKTGKDQKDINKSVTFACPVVCTFQYLISSCNKCYLNFLYIDATGYLLHLGAFIAFPLAWRYF